MNESNVKFGVLIFVMAILVWCIPVAGAENTTRADNLTHLTPASATYPLEPFITIDPIGNHTIGDLIFINGTTNLPVTDKLEIEVISTMFYPGPGLGISPYADIIDIPIFSTQTGINRYSVNVTDAVVNNLSMRPDKWSPYQVEVHLNGTSSSIKNYEVISLFPPTNTTHTNITQSVSQYLLLSQQTTRAITVLSTTKLPTTQPLSLPALFTVAALTVIAITITYLRKKGE